MQDDFIFSDLVHVLEYLKIEEKIAIVHSSFLDWNRNEFRFSTTLKKKYTPFNPADGSLDQSTKIIVCDFYRSQIYFDSAQLDVFIYKDTKFSTFDRVIAFLSEIGLIYRPDLMLPKNSDSAVKVDGTSYFCKDVMISSDRKTTVYGYSPSTYATSYFRVGK